MNTEEIRKQIETTDATINHLIDVKSMLEKQLSEVKPVRWRAEVGESYAFLPSNGGVAMGHEEGCDYDDYRYSSGNYHKSYGQALVENKRNLALIRVNDRIAQLNTEEKQECVVFEIYWDGHASLFASNETYTIDKWSSSLKSLNSKEAADQIIEDCCDDLKLIFGV